MADNNTVEILIRFGLDPAKAREAAKELDGLKAKSKEANETGGKAADDHAQKVHGLNKAWGLVRSQLGEVGHLLHFVTSGPALALAALAITIHKIVEAFTSWRARIEAAAMELQKLDRAKIDGARDAATKAALEMGKFASEIEKAKTSMNGLEQSFKNFRAAQQAAGISDAATDAAELARRTAKAPELEGAARVAGHIAANLAKDPELIAAQVTLAAEKAKTEELDTKARKARGNYSLAELEKLAANDTAEGGGYFANKFKEAKAAADALAANQAAIAAANYTVQQFGLKQTAADANAKQAQTAFTTNAARINELTAKADTAGAAMAGTSASGLFATASGLAQRFAAGQNLSVGEQTVLRQIGSVATGQSVDVGQAAGAFNNARNNPNTMQALVARLVALLEREREAPNGLAQRVAALEARFNRPQP